MPNQKTEQKAAETGLPRQAAVTINQAVMNTNGPVGTWARRFIPVRETIINFIWVLIIMMHGSPLPLAICIICALANVLTSSLKAFFFVGGQDQASQSPSRKAKLSEKALGHIMGATILLGFLASSFFSFYQAITAFSISGHLISSVLPLKVFMVISTLYVLTSLCKNYLAIVRTSKKQGIFANPHINHGIQQWIQSPYILWHKMCEQLGHLLQRLQPFAQDKASSENKILFTLKVLERDSEDSDQTIKRTKVEIEQTQYWVLLKPRGTSPRLKSTYFIRSDMLDLNTGIITLDKDKPDNATRARYYFRQVLSRAKKYGKFTVFAVCKMIKIIVSVTPLIAFGGMNTGFIVYATIAATLSSLIISSSILIQEPNKDKIPNGLFNLRTYKENSAQSTTLKKSFVQINKLKHRSTTTWAMLGSAAVLLLLSNEIKNILDLFGSFCAAHLTGSLELTVVLASALILCTTISLFNCTTGYLKFIRKNIDPIKSAEKEQKDLEAHEAAKQAFDQYAKKGSERTGRTTTIHFQPPSKEANKSPIILQPQSQDKIRSLDLNDTKQEQNPRPDSTDSTDTVNFTEEETLTPPHRTTIETVLPRPIPAAAS